MRAAVPVSPAEGGDGRGAVPAGGGEGEPPEGGGTAAAVGVPAPWRQRRAGRAAAAAGATTRPQAAVRSQGCDRHAPSPVAGTNSNERGVEYAMAMEGGGGRGSGWGNRSGKRGGWTRPPCCAVHSARGCGVGGVGHGRDPRWSALLCKYSYFVPRASRGGAYLVLPPGDRSGFGCLADSSHVPLLPAPVSSSSRSSPRRPL